MRRLLPLLLLLVLVSGCATARAAARRQAERDLDRVLAQALMLLGEERLRVGGSSYRSDCSGFVTAAYDAAELDLVGPDPRGRSGTEQIFRYLKSRGRIHADKRPRPGDLAFFHNTVDRNGNGLRDDRFTHIALVEKVNDDGTIQLMHFASGKVKRDVMNLYHPGDARDPATGRPRNSFLRRGGGKVLTGQLFFKFGRPRAR